MKYDDDDDDDDDGDGDGDDGDDDDAWGLQGSRQGPLRNAQVQNIFKIVRCTLNCRAPNFTNILNLCISLAKR